jgi:hypothetical protein
MPFAMSLRSLALLTVTAVLLTACATARERSLEAGYRLLSGDEIRALHADRTYEVKLASGRTAVAFYAANGRSTYTRSDGRANIGVWEIRGNHVCYVYQAVPGTEENCHSMAEKNGEYLFFKEFDGKHGDLSAEVVSIMPGNVNNLPVE